MRLIIIDNEQIIECHDPEIRKETLEDGYRIVVRYSNDRNVFSFRTYLYRSNDKSVIDAAFNAIAEAVISGEPADLRLKRLTT